MPTTTHPRTMPERPALSPRDPVRLGVVSFVNTLPLIDGLDDLADVALRSSVPSALIDQLLADEVDLALCSSIDYLRSPEPLVVVPAGLLGSEGPTLTVRLFSRVPIETLGRVHCDSDSHTSIALMQILLRERYGLRPELVDYHAGEQDAREHVSGNRPVESPDAVLLIGDKVVTDSPPADRYTHQLDLGEAWQTLTGLPFIFAVWLAKPATPRLGTAAAILDRQRRVNHGRIDTIIHRRVSPERWPRALVRRYLTENLVYEFTPERRRSLELFFAKAVEHGLARGRELRVL